MNYDIKKFKQNTKKLQQENLNIKNLDNDNIILKRNISEKYWKLERELKDKQYKEEDKIQQNYNKQLKKIKSDSETLKSINQQFRRIKTLRTLITKCIKLDDYSVYKYDYLKLENGSSDIEKGKQKTFYKPLFELENNEFLNMNLFITKNRKPKNKYSLIVVGKTFFCDNFGGSNNLLNTNVYEYGLNIHTDNANIKINIKDFPTFKQAEQYAEKNKEKILKIFREEHNNLIFEYKDVIENTNSTDWKIAVLEDGKHYYEKCYSNGKEEPQYKEIIKELNILNKKVD